eukprot:7134108-Prymnesium_polylepis.2
MTAAGRMPAAAAEALWRLMSKRPVSEAHVAALLYTDNSTFSPGGTLWPAAERYHSDVLPRRPRQLPDDDDDDDDNDDAPAPDTQRTVRTQPTRDRGQSYRRVREILDRPCSERVRSAGVVPNDDYVELGDTSGFCTCPATLRLTRPMICSLRIAALPANARAR